MNNKETKEETEELKRIKEEAKAAREAVAGDDGQYHPEDDIDQIGGGC